MLERAGSFLGQLHDPVTASERLTGAALSGRLSSDAACTAGRVAEHELRRRQQARQSWSHDWSRASRVQLRSWVR